MKNKPKKINLPDDHVVQDLTESLHELEDRLEQVNKPSRNFFIGMLSGFGGAIGATLLVALLIGLLSWLSYQTESFPALNKFFNNVTEQISE